MARLSLNLVAPILVTLLAGAVPAQIKSYTVQLAGAQESPPVVSNGTGTATVTLDTGTGALTVSGSFSNLNGVATAAHIHGTPLSPARRGGNSGVMVPLTESGGTSGTLGGGATLTAAEMQVLMDGLTYVNLHSTSHPGGELRGQIDTVPGSGSPGALPVGISGPATGGGTISVTCPASAGTAVIFFGLPLPPCAVALLPPPIACTPGPVNLGVNLALPPLVVSAASVAVTIPAAVTSADLAIQCVYLDPAVCVNLSAAVRLAIRP